MTCGAPCVQTFEETERRHWADMESEWEQEKQKILTALVGTGQDMLDFPHDSQVTSCVLVELLGPPAVQFVYTRPYTLVTLLHIQHHLWDNCVV